MKGVCHRVRLSVSLQRRVVKMWQKKGNATFWHTFRYSYGVARSDMIGIIL